MRTANETAAGLPRGAAGRLGAAGLAGDPVLSGIPGSSMSVTAGAGPAGAASAACPPSRPAPVAAARRVAEASIASRCSTAARCSSQALAGQSGSVSAFAARTITRWPRPHRWQLTARAALTRGLMSLTTHQKSAGSWPRSRSTREAARSMPPVPAAGSAIDMPGVRSPVRVMRAITSQTAAGV
jgi:hypothetical protein